MSRTKSACLTFAFAVMFGILPSCTPDDGSGNICDDIEIRFNGEHTAFFNNVEIFDSMVFIKLSDGVIRDTIVLNQKFVVGDLLPLPHCSNATRFSERKSFVYQWSKKSGQFSLDFVRSASSVTRAFAIWGNYDLYCESFFVTEGVTISNLTDTFSNCKGFIDVLKPQNSGSGLEKYFDSVAQLGTMSESSDVKVYFSDLWGIVRFQRTNEEGELIEYQRILN